METQGKTPNDKLRYFREIRGWSQRYVAEQIGTSETEVSRWEGGVRKPGRYYQTKLCELFTATALELGFMETKIVTPDITEEGCHSFQGRFLKYHNPGPTSNSELFKGLLYRNFSKQITYDLLSSNIKTMNFRDEWQYIVNNLVSETKVGLRAMVFDVELTRWWNTIAGQIYMMTNMELLKRSVPVKRLFILSSLDTRLRMNALMNAYVHHKIGVDVKVCKITNFQENLPFKPDMFSVHDNSFVALYYFSFEKPLTNLLLEDKYITEFRSFYDELFMDDRLCVDIESVLESSHYGEGFFSAMKTQLELLQRLEKVGSVTELTRKLWI
jgi:transcriptional regulator with XRE-family HTH domain